MGEDEKEVNLDVEGWLLTIIILPRGDNVRQVRSLWHSPGEEFEFLPSTGQHIRSVKFADCLRTVTLEYPVPNPAFIVAAISEIIAQRRIRGFNVHGLRNASAVNQ